MLSGYQLLLFTQIFQNFLIYKVLWTLNLYEGVSRNQLILVTLNLTSKFFWNFFIFRVLWTLNFSEGVSGHQLFFVMLNLRSKIFWNFFLSHALWTLNLSGDGVWTPTCFGDSKFEVKFFGIFNLQTLVYAEFFAEGSGHQLFLVMLNLK